MEKGEGHTLQLCYSCLMGLGRGGSKVAGVECRSIVVLPNPLQLTRQCPVLTHNKFLQDTRVMKYTTVYFSYIQLLCFTPIYSTLSMQCSTGQAVFIRRCQLFLSIVSNYLCSPSMAR